MCYSKADLRAQPRQGRPRRPRSEPWGQLGGADTAIAGLNGLGVRPEMDRSRPSPAGCAQNVEGCFADRPWRVQTVCDDRDAERHRPGVEDAQATSAGTSPCATQGSVGAHGLAATPTSTARESSCGEKPEFYGEKPE